MIDRLTVAKGYEAALGAALGDDLEAPIDATAPMRWTGAAIDPADPTLPAGVEALADRVEAPPELARRLSQIGVIAREDAPRLTPQLKAGQRFVSREGDLWRWDGFTVAANAPTGAVRRLAGKNRLADIEAELEAARRDVEKARQTAANEAEARGSIRRRGRDRGARALASAAAGSCFRARPSCRSRARRQSQRGAPVRARRSDRAPDRRSRGGCGGVFQRERLLAALPPSADLGSTIARAPRSRCGAPVSPRCARSRRRWRAKPRSRRGGLPPSLPITRPGASAAGAAARIETLEARVAEAGGARSLEDAPRLFEEKRRALIDEITTAEAGRRDAADILVRGEHALAEADRAARAALEAMGAAREEAARAEERFEGGGRRLADVAHEINEMLEIEPAEVAGLAGIGSDQTLPDVVEVEANLERLRREREQLGAVNLQAEEELREVETQRLARHGARRSGGGDQQRHAGASRISIARPVSLAHLLRGGQRPLHASVH